MNRRIIIVANGRLYRKIITDIQTTDFVIGVDRAAYWLIRNGIIPDVAIGDFDSTKRGELAVIKQNVSIVQSFPKEKDFIDTELALRYAIRQKPRSIIIYGGMGTRMDQTLGTLHLLEYCSRRGIRTVGRDETNDMTVVHRGRTILEKRAGSRYVSIVPITSKIQISLSGFKYEITKKTIHRGQTIGISNEFTGRQAEIVLHRGTAFVIQSRD